MRCRPPEGSLLSSRGVSFSGLHRALSGAGTGDAGTLLHRLHVLAVGRHPRLRPWHHQWLVGTPLYRVLRPLLATLEGDVLDVGSSSPTKRRI